VNRTDRLYAIVEELRSVAPRRRSARELAARYEVSMRTIERDISALQQADVPIYADVGRRGGFALDKSMSLPPLNFTPAEPVLFMTAIGHWYLIAWCRLRQAARAFRVDRILRAETTGEPAPEHSYQAFAPRLPDLISRTPALG
jgi:predicted DNA-binding transcriptional regulator YafY